MTTLSVSVSDEVMRRAREQFADEAEISAFLADVLAGVTSNAEPLDPQTEALLTQGMNSPALKGEEIDWDAKIARLKALRG